MAVLATKTMGELNQEHKPMYPLFSKASRPLQLPSRKGSDQIFPATLECQSDSEAGRTANSEVTSKTKKAAKPKISKFSISTKPTAGVSNSEHEEVLEVDPNNGRKKRRKTDPPATKDGDNNAQASSAGPNSVLPNHESQQKIPRDNKSSSSIAGVRDSKLMAESTSLKQSITEGEGSDHTLHTPDKKQFPIPTIQNAEVSAGNVIEASENTPNSSAASESKIKATSTGGKTVERKPSKVLRLNPKTGTIGSPPAKKSKPLGDKPGKGTLKGNRQGPNSRIVTIRYGLSSIGLKVDQILNNEKLPPPVADKVECPEIASGDSSKPLKSIHPLFLGKATAKLSSPKKLPKQDAPDVDAQRRIGSIILGRTRPGSLDNSALPFKAKVSAFSEFGSAGKVLKFPGAVEPAWPARGMVHVRGHAQGMNEVQQQGQYAMQIRSNIKKSKYQAIEVLAQEDVVGALATDLCIGDVAKGIQEINLDQFPALPSCLRLPVKHFETGADLQRRVRREICTPLPSPNTADTSSSEDELRGSGSTRGRIHPALKKTYNSIATSLSAFDQGQCETQPWTHKYSPRSAAEVLQTGKDAFILKEWLQTLTVMSVETGTRNRSGSRASSVSRHSATSKPGYPGKRKRKSKKLEGFVVSSEEEDNDMDEISEPEDDPSPRGSQGLLKKTVVRAGDMGARGFKDSVRLTNAVVVSGPHGCGKTAAAYAVAKELGFEVFEINSSSRRSGKDILEKVGDMTRNHLVQRSQIQSQVDPIDEDAQRISDALADDLKSGRQGTMNSFFKPKPSTIAKPKSKKPISAKEQLEATKNNFAPKVPAKYQKQSLILLEEVDILYEEDKQFWATVLNLIAQSKRPIIMTCNDESALPLQSLSLHAIIRFIPPPIDLAVDYMLLVAACEGHALRRDAVSALYESRHLDLRASLMELDFWCQFAVGDLKCGLDWYYPRWPRGSDIDTQGNVIRVVSEGSLGTGMGWLSQDFLYSHLHHLDIEEEILHEAWDGWNLDIGDWQQNLDLTAWADKTTALSTSKTDCRSALNIYVNFAEAMSVADLCSGSAFAPSDRVLLDFTLPELSGKARDDYVLAHELLEASPLADFDTLSMDISLWMKSRARNNLQVDQQIQHGFEAAKSLDRASELDVLQLIRKKSSAGTAISRRDFSLAFDPISEPEKGSSSNNGSLEASSFDRTTAIIATDLAPFVRSVVAYDARLQQDRARMSNLLSEGGRRGKRMRTTRAAMSALEGGARSITRREKYFGPDLNPYLVLKTGMQSWLDAAMETPSGSSGSRMSNEAGSEASRLDIDMEHDESMMDTP